MADIEKVIKGLEWILDGDRFGFGENWHIESEPKSEEEQAGYNIQNAITMLKEQEAVEPLAKEDDSYECICGAIVGWDELDASGIVQTRLNYCPFCGKPISWEGR